MGASRSIPQPASKSVASACPELSSGALACLRKLAAGPCGIPRPASTAHAGEKDRMKVFVPHRESLPEAQLSLWPQLRPTADLGRVLIRRHRDRTAAGTQTFPRFRFLYRKAAGSRSPEDLFPFHRTFDNRSGQKEHILCSLSSR